MLVRATKLKKWGNSQGIILPKETLKQAGVVDLEDVSFDIISTRHEIILKPKNKSTRMEKLFENYTGGHLNDSEIIENSVGEELDL